MRRKHGRQKPGSRADREEDDEEPFLQTLCGSCGKPANKGDLETSFFLLVCNKCRGPQVWLEKVPVEQSPSESSRSREEQLVQAFDSSALDEESLCADLPPAIPVTRESLIRTDAGEIQHSAKVKNGEASCIESQVKRSRVQINKQMHPLEEIKDLDGKQSKNKYHEDSDWNGRFSVASTDLSRQQMQGNNTKRTSGESRIKEEPHHIPCQKRKRGDHETASNAEELGAKKRLCTEGKANGEEELEPYVSMKIFDSDAEVEKPKAISSDTPLRRPAKGKSSRPAKGNSSRQALALGKTTTKVADEYLANASKDEEPKTRVGCKQNKEQITTLHVEGVPSEEMVVLDTHNLYTSDMGAQESVCVDAKEKGTIEPEPALSIKTSASPKNVSISKQQIAVDSNTKTKRPTDINLVGSKALSCRPVKGRSSRQDLPNEEKTIKLTDPDATKGEEPNTQVQCQHNTKQPNSSKDSPCKKIIAQNEREIRSKQVCVAKFRVGLNELREELEAAVVGQDFTRAQMVKGKIDSMEQQMTSAVEEVQELLGKEAPSSSTKETVAAAKQEPPPKAADREGKEKAETAPKPNETSNLDKTLRMQTIPVLEPLEAPASSCKDTNEKKKFCADEKPYGEYDLEPIMSLKKVVSKNSTTSQLENNTTVSDKPQIESSKVSREKSCQQKRMPSRRVSPVKDNTTKARNLDMKDAKTDDKHITRVQQSQKENQSKAPQAVLESLETLISDCKTSPETLKRLQPYVLLPTSPSKKYLLKNPHFIKEAESLSRQKPNELLESQGKPMVAPEPEPSLQKPTKRGRPKLSNPSKGKGTKSCMPSESIISDSFKSCKRIEIREATNILSKCATPKPTVSEEAFVESKNEIQSSPLEKTSKRLSRKCATPQKESQTKVLDPQLVKALSGPKIVLVINKALLAEARKNRRKKSRDSLMSATHKISRLQNELKRIVARKELRESLSFVLHFDIKLKQVTFKEVMKKKKINDTATTQTKKGEKEKRVGSRKSAREKVNTEENDLPAVQEDADSQPTQEAKTITKGRPRKPGKQKDAKEITPGQAQQDIIQPKMALSQGSRRSVREQKAAAVPVKPISQQTLGKGGRRGARGSAARKPEGEMDLFYQICPLKPCCQSKAGVMQSSGRKGAKRRTGAGAEIRPGKYVGLGEQGVTGAGGGPGAGAKRCMSLGRLARRPIQRRKIRFHAFIYNGSCLGLWKEDVSMGRIHIQLTSDEDGGKGDEGRRALNQPILSDLTNRGRVGKVQFLARKKPDQMWRNSGFNSRIKTMISKNGTIQMTVNKDTEEVDMPSFPGPSVSKYYKIRRRSNIGGFSPSSQTSSSPLASPVPSSSSALTSCSSPALHSPVPEASPPAPVNILMKPLESMKLKVPKKHKRSKEKKLKHFVSPKRLKIMYRNLYGRVIQFAKNLPKPTVK